MSPLPAMNDENFLLSSSRRDSWLRSSRPPISAQFSPSATWAAHADATNIRWLPNLTYLTASNYESKLDIYYRRGATTPQPTIVYFHGGFWAAGNKEGAS